VVAAVEVAVVDKGRGAVGRELTANGRNVGKAAFAGSLIEPELDGLLGDGEQRELLGVGLVSWTLGHSVIIAEGCDTVVG